MMENYFVVFWKNLKNDEVKISSFHNELDAKEFSSIMVSKGYSVFFVSKKPNTIDSVINTYKLKPFGAYSFYKRIDSWLILLLSFGILGAYQLFRIHFLK